MTEKLKKQMPDPFAPKCNCGKPDCKVDVLGCKLAKALGYTNNTAIMALAMLKEVSTAAPIPGLRQAAGGALVILEAIGAMGDNKAAFTQLAHQCIDHCTLLISCNDMLEKHCKNADDIMERFGNQAQEFAGIMQHIQGVMVKLNKRSKFTRFIHSKADKNELDKYRSDMHHSISKLQIFIQMATLARAGGNPNDAPTKFKEELKEEEIHAVAESFIKKRLQKAEKQHEEEVKEYLRISNSPNFSVTSNPTVTAGDNSTITSSGNVKTTVISGQNDYSQNHINITGGGVGTDGWGRPRRQRHDSDDSGW